MLNKEVENWKAKGRYFKYKAHNIFYIKEGVGPNLLLIHGYPFNTYDWIEIWDSLTARFTVIAPDMLGMGFSDKPKKYNYTIHDHTDMHEALLEHFGVKDFHFIAHDMGNSVAQEIIARHEEGTYADRFHIHSVTYLNGGLFIDVYQPRLMQRLLSESPFGKWIAKMTTKGIASRAVSEVFGPNTKPTQKMLDDFWQILTYNDGKSITYLIGRFIRDRKQHQTRWVNAIQSTKIPMRFINGPYDPNSGQHMVDRYLELIPNPDVKCLDPSIGHWPQLEDPENTLRYFYEFIDGLGSEQ